VRRFNKQLKFLMKKKGNDGDGAFKRKEVKEQSQFGTWCDEEKKPWLCQS
jgi:hypothetical protein